MILKIILIILVILIAILIILPFVLNIAGFRVFQFGSSGGGALGKEAVLYSSDNGDNWKEANVEDMRESLPTTIFDIAFHPQNKDRLFLGAKSAGLWRSDNGGQTWRRINDNSGVLDSRGDVYRIVIPRGNPKVMYLAVFAKNRGRVLKSEDGGETFREIYFVTADRFGVFDLYADAGNSDHVIIVTGQGGVLESYDGGKEWRVVHWFREAVTTLAVNPVFPNEMFVVSASERLWKTFNGGANWTDLKKGLDKTFSQYQRQDVGMKPFSPFIVGRSNVETFVPDPNIFTTLYLGARIGLLRSQNGGFSWTHLNILIPPESLPVKTVALNPRDSREIFAGAGQELYKSKDAGLTWSIITLPTRLKIQKLFIHPEKPGFMFTILGR